MKTRQSYLVTGGGGFVGRAICQQLLKDGHAVRSISRGDYPALREDGVQTVQADLTQWSESTKQAFSSADAVFHVAANVSMWSPLETAFRDNVLATRNVVRLCRLNSIRYLVFTSTPSVIADGTDRCGVDESVPYPARFESTYAETKAIAEREVLAANSDDLYTCALRPHLVWGPGDRNLVPTVLDRARKGRLIRIGSGRNLVDTTFIDDCAYAHSCAINALVQNPAARGKAYFVSQGQPVVLWDWIAEILSRQGIAPVTRSLSLRKARILAHALEALARLRPAGNNPSLTRFLVSEMATSHFFSIERARGLLGFEPRYTMDEAMDLTFPNDDNSCG